MKPATNVDKKMLTEAYETINEGMLDRAGANIAGWTQGAKNVWQGVKAAGNAVVGNTQAAQQNVAQMQDTGAAKQQSILQASAKNFMTDVYKLGLLQGKEPTAKDIAGLMNVISPYLTQLQQQRTPKPRGKAKAPAPAPGAPAPAPAP